MTLLVFCMLVGACVLGAVAAGLILGLGCYYAVMRGLGW